MQLDRKAEIRELMTRLADGDRAAFDPLFHALWPILKGMAARALGPGPDAEDAAQQTLFKLLRSSSSYDGARPVLPWIVTIAANECRSTERRRRSRPEDARGELPVVPDGGASPEDAAIAADLGRAVREALDAVPAADAATLRADLQGSAPGGDATFRKRRQRALARLRAVWSTRHGDV